MQHTVTKRDGETTVELRLTLGSGAGTAEYSATIEYRRNGRYVTLERKRGGVTTKLAQETCPKGTVRGRWTKPAFEADVAFDLGQCAARDSFGPALSKASDVAIAAAAVVHAFETPLALADRDTRLAVLKTKLQAVRA